MASAVLRVRTDTTIVDQLAAYLHAHGQDPFMTDLRRAMDEGQQIVEAKQNGSEGGWLWFEVVPSEFLLDLMAVHGVTL